MGRRPKDMPRVLCGAKQKDSRGGGTCKLTAGQGTDHLGTGPCRYHGGCAKGAKPGNDNALKHGRYAGIFADNLSEGEQDVMTVVAEKSPRDLLVEEIGLLSVREKRMLAIVADLKAAGAMTVVEETIETLVPEAGGDLPSERDLSEMTPAQAEKATEAEEPVTKRKRKSAGTLGQILTAEANLTAVQASKARAIAKLHEMDNPIRKPGDPGGDPLEDEVPDGAADARRATGLATLLDRARARTPGQDAGGDPV